MGSAPDLTDLHGINMGSPSDPHDRHDHHDHHDLHDLHRIHTDLHDPHVSERLKVNPSNVEKVEKKIWSKNFPLKFEKT
jgi:hypothetical protein